MNAQIKPQENWTQNGRLDSVGMGTEKNRGEIYQISLIGPIYLISQEAELLLTRR